MCDGDCEGCGQEYDCFPFRLKQEEGEKAKNKSGLVTAFLRHYAICLSSIRHNRNEIPF